MTNGADLMTPEQLPNLAEKLAISTDDVVMYVIAWKLGAATPFRISLAEWTAGTRTMRITSIKDLQRALPNMRQEIVTSAAQFKKFYEFIFEWTRETEQAKFLPNESACELWELLFANRDFPLLMNWLEYCKTEYKKSVSRDLWKQLLEFSIQFGAESKLAQFDPEAAWPTAIDGFVEWMKKKAL